MAYTVADMRNGVAGVLNELGSVSSACSEAMNALTAQINQVESVWQGRSGAAMAEALAAQKARLQNVQGRIVLLIAEISRSADSAAVVWQEEETEE